MYQVLDKKVLAPNIKMFEVHTPEIAGKAQAGQFVMIRTDEKSERIPLTIHDFDSEKGTLKIIFQEIGFSTKHLGCLNKGDAILDIAGPLGMPSDIKNFGKVLLIGGGVGTAPIYPLAKALKAAGNTVTSIIGAKSADSLILKEEMQSVSDNLYVCTDDGSLGIKGFVTDVLKQLINGDAEKPDMITTIGPLPMMKAVAEATKPFNIKTIVSLNPIMVDGTGMCGACRVTVGGQTKFACVDGPEFDGHKVDWEGLIRRSKMYYKEEQLIAQKGLQLGGSCRCH